MVEAVWCEWCELWDAEVGVIYAKTAMGRRAPLLRVDIGDPLPEGIVIVTRLRYTPTFVLLDDGREVGRIEGYPGEGFFWDLLDRLLQKLPESIPAKEPAIEAIDDTIDVSGEKKVG